MLHYAIECNCVELYTLSTIYIIYTLPISIMFLADLIDDEAHHGHQISGILQI